MSLKRSIDAKLNFNFLKVLPYFLIIPVLFLFLPWHQNIVAYGKVSAFDANERAQIVSSPIEGSINQWYVKEGDFVQQGDQLVEVIDIDPGFQQRVASKRDNMKDKKTSKMEELQAYKLLQDNLTNAKKARINALTAQINGNQASLDTAKFQKERFLRLYDNGLVSKRDLEVAERDFIVASRELDSVRSELINIKAEMDTKIDANNAVINRIQGEIAEIDNEIIRLDIDLSRQASRVIKSPKDGYVYRLHANSSAAFVNFGERLLTIIPSNAQRAVELIVDGRDTPLIEKGEEVRIEFEGWPAIQVSGWAKLGFGTFKGIVSFVDSFDNGTGDFRVMIIPSDNDPWPSDQFLKQGTTVKSWIFLERVSIGYELWRLINGFPPRLPESVKETLS
jgi:adhesin transport system membrane fusion protein